MKSRMKSAFAIIAVALMIMVAVVPMVSVFTENSAAADAIEYNNVLNDAQAINITGNVTDKGLNVEGALVTVVYDGKTLTAITTTDGAYTVKTDVPITTGVIKQVKVTVDTTSLLVNGKANPAYGIGFPTVTAENISQDVALNVVSNTAKITGKLVTSNTTDVYLSDVTISGAEGTVKTMAGGFSFYGKIGKEYALTASALGTRFVADKVTVAADGNSSVSLVAEGKIATITLQTVPMVPTLTKIAATGTDVDSVSSLGALTLGTDGTNSYAYALINYSTAALAEGQSFVQTTFNVTYSLTVEKSTVSIGVAQAGSAGEKVAPADVAVNSTLTYIASGDMTVGGINVTPAASISGKAADTAATAFTKTATIIDDKWYVQSFYGYNTAGVVIELAANPVITGTYAGYTFNTLTTSGTFTATNAVKVSGSVDKLPTGTYISAVTVTAQNFVADIDDLVIAYYGASGTNKLTYEFYVPENTSVTVSAPTTDYMPAKYVNDKVTANTAVGEFKYNSAVESTTYTGKVTLNGVAISLADADLKVSTDGGESFGTTTVKFDTDAYSAAYNTYSFTVAKSISASDIVVKVAQAYEGGYAFTSTYMTPVSGSQYYYDFFTVTGTTVADIPVKAQKISVTVQDANTSATAIVGQKVNFYMSGKTYSALTAVSLGSATTDEHGIATIQAAKVLSESVETETHRIYAIPEGDATYGTYAYNETPVKVNVSSATTITSQSKTTSGTVLTKAGAIVANPSITYVAYNNTVIYGQGTAKVIDGKYYIVENANVNKIVVKIAGYEGSSTGTYKISGVGTLSADIKNVESTAATTYTVTSSGLFSDKVDISAATGVKGTVITFSAVSEYTIEDEKNKYTDGYTKYTFKAWYVNGKQVSTDAVTSYTIGDESIVVSADYAVEHVTTGEVKVEEKQGVDSTVLVIGIAAVVIALIAVVYAVIQKKN